MVRVPWPELTKTRVYRNTSQLNSIKATQTICDRLNYSYNGSKLDILDVYPGNGVFSAGVHNALQPKQHLLLEDRLQFHKILTQYIENIDAQPSFKGHTLKHLKLSPYSWSTYLDLTNPETGIVHPGKETRDHIHSKLLLTGTIGEESLVMQWLACMGYKNWIQRFGNVRMLLWVPEATAIKVLALPGSAARNKCSLVRETFSDARLLATANTPKFQKGAFDPSVLKEGNTEVLDEKDFTGLPMSLVEINPKDHNTNMFEWDYVTKCMMILRNKSVQESIGNLGPGAQDYFKDLLPKELQNKRAKDLVASEFAYIAEKFELWPFKPDNLLDSIIEE